MSKEIIAFCNIKIEKRKFHHLKNLILLEGVDIDQTIISSTVSSSERIINVLLVTRMMIIKLNHLA